MFSYNFLVDLNNWFQLSSWNMTLVENAQL